MFYIISRGDGIDNRAILVDSPLTLEDMQEIVRCVEFEVAACVVGVVQEATWVGNKDTVVQSIAEYCPPVKPQYVRTHFSLKYVGPALRLYPGDDEKAPMNPAVWRRLVRMIDTKRLWEKTYLNHHLEPTYLAAAKKLALDHAKTLP
jgi:hypothetical protein